MAEGSPGAMRAVIMPAWRRAADDAELVEVGPVLDDLAVSDRQEMDFGPVHGSARRGPPEELARTRSGDVIVEDHEVALRDDVPDLDGQVGKRGPGGDNHAAEAVLRAGDAGHRDV